MSHPAPDQPAPARASLTGAEIEAAFRERGALLQGHFKLSSGLESTHYIQCQQVMGDPAYARRLARTLAEAIRPLKPEAIVGPAVGAIVIAHLVAEELGVRSLFPERVEGAFRFRRGQALREGERVVVAENVVTTGGSAREAVALCRALGAAPVGVCALIDRSPSDTAPFTDMPFSALLVVDAPVFSADDRPDSLRDSEPVKPGSRYLGAS